MIIIIRPNILPNARKASANTRNPRKTVIAMLESVRKSRIVRKKRRRQCVT